METMDCWVDYSNRPIVEFGYTFGKCTDENRHVYHTIALFECTDDSDCYHAIHSILYNMLFYRARINKELDEQRSRITDNTCKFNIKINTYEGYSKMEDIIAVTRIIKHIYCQSCDPIYICDENATPEPRNITCYYDKELNIIGFVDLRYYPMYYNNECFATKECDITDNLYDGETYYFDLFTHMIERKSGVRLTLTFDKQVRHNAYGHIAFKVTPEEAERIINAVNSIDVIRYIQQ